MDTWAVAGMLNFYNIFVNIVFGGVALAWIGLVALFVLIAMFTRMTPLSTMYMIILFSLHYVVAGTTNTASLLAKVAIMFCASAYLIYAGYAAWQTRSGGSWGSG